MGKAIFQQVKTAILRAARTGDTEICLLGITVSIQHVRGNEYRAVLPDGGEILRLDWVGSEPVVA